VAESVWLVRDGKAEFRVEVWPPQDAEGIREALTELVIHLEACLAAPVPWFDRLAPAPGARLVLRSSPAAGLGREEYRITAEPGVVTLLASTPTAMTHAVHDFLERAFGVRWLWPGMTGTVTPRARDVAWPLGETTHKPDWAWRRLWVGGAFWREDDCWLAELKKGGVRPGTLAELELWQKRNRLGGLRIADGHRWAQICSPLEYGPTHPEYFALINGARDTALHDGKHGNQPCTTNPDVIRHTADYIKAQFRARPELDGFSLAVNDGMGFCECDACKALDAWAGAAKRQDGVFDDLTREDTAAPGAVAGCPAITDRMLRFANDVAAQVAREFPDKLLLVLIYSVYRTPPRRVKLAPNVIAQFCTMTWSHAAPAIHDREIAVLEALAAWTQERGVYDYFVNGANGSMPRGFARVFWRSAQKYYALGCRHFASQAGLDFSTGGLAYYAAARLLWNTRQEFDAVFEDYCASGFGPAAPQVRRYFQAFMDRWEEAEGGARLGAKEMVLQAPLLYPGAWRAARRAELDEALRVCGDDDASLRVAFLAEGLDFLDLLCEAGVAAQDLLALGAPSDGAEWRGWLASRPEAAAKAREAVDRWRKLTGWVDTHRDGFWFSAMWFDYQRAARGGLLGGWFQKLAAAAGETS